MVFVVQRQRLMPVVVSLIFSWNDRQTTAVTIYHCPCAGSGGGCDKGVFVAMDGDNKRSGMTQRETIASLDIGREDPVLNRYE